MAKRTSNMIVKLFRTKKVAKFEEIQEALCAASRTTTFRYLKKVEYVRSYNHNGRYYTSKEAIVFDRLGLYSYGDICFSRDRKLDKTVSRLVYESEAGLTQRELQDMLKVRVQVLLLEGVRRRIICREKVEGFYLYLHNDPVYRESQLKVRHSHIADDGSSNKVDLQQIDSVVIKVLLVLIRQPGSHPAEVVRALRGYVPPITMEQVVNVFNRYSLDEIGKKKGSTDF
jgi:predicted nucleic acid-binding protein